MTTKERALGALIAIAMMTSTSASAQGLPSAEDMWNEAPPAESTEEVDAPAEEEAPAEDAAVEEAPSDEAEAAEVVAEAETEDDGAEVEDDAAVASDEGAGAVTDEGEEPVEAERVRISPSMNLEGAPGFHGIASAISPGALMFQVGFLGEASGGSNVIRLNDENRTLSGNVAVSGQIVENFGFNFRMQARNNINTFGRPQAMLSQGDVSAGVIGRYEVSPGVWLGGDLNLFMPSGFGGVGLSASSLSLRPRFLASFDIGEMSQQQGGGDVPVVGHFNVGYRFDQSENLVPEGVQLDRVERFAYGISAYDLVEFGIGAEVPLPYVTPFVGYQLAVPVNGRGGVCDEDRALACVSDIGGAAFPQKISVGLKAEPLENLGLHAGVDLGLTSSDAEGLPVTLPYNVIFGMSWNIDTSGPKIIIEEREVEKVVEVEPTLGYVVGTVVNAETGEPVGDARIYYTNQTLAGQLSGAENGVFRSYGFEPGEALELRVVHPHYEEAVASTTVVEGEGTLEVKLTPLPRQAWVRGQVTDAEGGPLANATVRLSGEDGPVEVMTDEEGRFEAELQSGEYTVAAKAEGYLTAGQDVSLEPDAEMQMVLSLSEAGEQLVELSEEEIRINERIYFETGAATILERSFNVLNQVAAVLLENPQIELVQIEGHTDDVGDSEFNMELSQARAEEVRNYLVERGIRLERLGAQGFGSERPLVPNTSNRNRSLNRRVEFKIPSTEE
ncbi:OmpA family protein [Lujinxingia vulgaris]|uniref:OmpA family protein n=1 Tax=Lujinxingia vulgaris TaxID=2600176 RepID=A0A5C6XNC9_9DELT|nr:OmpA family protein [Lujinxingia vulgaris]TXD42996.1 OmpA family protein [Lujinxingia vulgaris]